MRTMMYKGPWFDGKANFIVILVNRLGHKKEDFYFLGYYNHPDETEVQRIRYVEDPMSVDYYVGFD